MTPRRLARLALWLALALVLLADHEAGAAAPTDQLRASIDRVIKVLEDPELRKESRTRERRAAIRAIATDAFDFEDMTRRALARHWQARTPAERGEFVQLFASLLESSYISKLELYGGEKVSYAGDKIDGDQGTVRTRIVTKQGTEIPVDYRMHSRGDRWLVYDVVIEGMSLIANYRAQFARIIQTSSYTELVAKLRAKEVSAAGTARAKEPARDGRPR